MNLARKIYDAIPSPSPTSPRFIPGELSDIAFVDGSDVAYVTGRAGDLMVRVTFSPTSVDVGSTQNTEIDLGGSDAIGRCQAPTGLVIDHAHAFAYVNCWMTSRLGVVDLAAQALTATVESVPQPTDGDRSIDRARPPLLLHGTRPMVGGGRQRRGGRRRLVVMRLVSSRWPHRQHDVELHGRSAPDDVAGRHVACDGNPACRSSGCSTGPRSFDEHHDFERNTRNVSGGLGAITTATPLSDCGQLDKEIEVNIKPGGVAIGGLQQPFKELADDPTTCANKNWDDVEAYVKTIQPVHAKRIVDVAQIARGRQLFTDGGCAKCHGGSGWTVSRPLLRADVSGER